MSLANLDVYFLRNIAKANLTLNPDCNFFCGENGSGKTSLLEAIYLLSTGRSFRSHKTVPLVHYGESNLVVFGKTPKQETICLQKHISGPTTVKLNGQNCNSSSVLARFLPCQVLYQDIFQIIDAGPSTRRQLLDWGMFHVKHSYLDLWQKYRKVLKQRNALLRQRACKNEFTPWNKALCELAVAINKLRDEYMQKWTLVFKEVLGKLGDVKCDMRLYKGWDRKGSGISLETILDDHFEADQQRQYTQYGAHQADIIFDSKSQLAKQALSRGQQKIVLIALKLAQGSLLDKPCMYLFDDISSEIDDGNLNRVLKLISELPGQKFFTSTDIGNLNTKIISGKVFHLEGGTVTE